MAKLYKIAVIGLLLKNNTVEKHGTLVTADQLPRAVEDLLKENFITEATKEEIEAVKKAEKSTGDVDAQKLKEQQKVNEAEKQKAIDAQKAEDLKKQKEADDEAEALRQAQIDADLANQAEAEKEAEKLADAPKANPLDKLKR
jgi:hypothetical protein